MDPELAWEDLAAAALLGTDRRPFAPPPADGPLGALLGGLAGLAPEKLLLGTAAALAPYRRAGRRPTTDPSSPLEPAGLDGRPRCSSASDGHLAAMLSGTHAEALPEWLDALNSAGKRPTAESLPGLLDLGRARAEIRPAVVEAIGPLGAWLARQNPDWAYASGSDPAPDGVDPDDDWQTGSVEHRTTLLKRLRRLDPDRGRALVASTWASDGPEVRASFLGEFAAGLSMADEPFLEDALDDRRKEVRSAASGLLARLPGSRLVGRMVERVDPLIRSSSSSLDVTLPSACDKAMIRDGVEPKVAWLGQGEKAGWLYQMLATIPPSTWSRAWGRTPAELAEEAIKNKWSDALYLGWIKAAILHDEAEWVDALLPHRRLAGRAFHLLDEVPTLRESTVLKLIRAEDGSPRIRFRGDPLTEEQMDLLQQTPGPWGPELSALVLERLPRNLADRNHLHYALAGFLPAAARWLPPADVLASPPRRTVPDDGVSGPLLYQVEAQLEEFHALIQFRHDMTQELRR